MKKNTLVAIILLLGGIAAVYIIKAMLPGMRQDFAYDTSDAKNFKGEISIALDSWIGYYPLESPVFKKLMREEGYKINTINDNADYPERMKKLSSGEIDFAVVTIDSYLLNGKDVNFPGTIVLAIDESKGGDALVAWENKVNNLNDLKGLKNFKLAFTPDSPSEHLLKSLGAHFGVSELFNKQGNWRVPTNGAEEAYKKLMNKEVEIAALWEPHVTQALNKPGVVKLLGTEDTENLIVDILVVNREFSRNKRELVSLMLKNYFKTQEIYGKDPELLRKDIKTTTGDPENQVKSMLEGVRWLSFNENIQWFGIVPSNNYYKEELFISIDSALRILLENGDFSGNPLPNEDPYTIVNSTFLENFYMNGTFRDQQAAAETNSLEKAFPPLKPEQWKKLKVVGALKLRPITFKSGTPELDNRGESQMNDIVENVRHYPNFRIMIKGHTGQRGEREANRLLSLKRAESVKKYMQDVYNIHETRMFALGVGSDEPLLKADGESARAHDTRLKRVEIYMVRPEL